VLPRDRREETRRYRLPRNIRGALWLKIFYARARSRVFDNDETLHIIAVYISDLELSLSQTSFSVINSQR